MPLGKLSRAKLPKEVRGYISIVRQAIAAIDDALKGPSTLERGQRVGRIVSALELQTDILEHFGIKGWPSAPVASSRRARGETR